MGTAVSRKRLLAFITRWIVDAILLQLTNALTDRLTIRGYGTALVGALLISLFGTFGQWLVSGILA